MKKFLLSFILFSVFVSCSLALPEPERKSGIKIVSWNVQNVFDAVDDGSEYDEYKSNGYWSESLFRLRLGNIQSVFSYDKLKDADIVILNEVENENVVKNILNLKVFRDRGFKYYAVAGEKYGAIKVAIISHLPIEDFHVHSIENCRPVVQVKINGIYILACHAKSRVEGTEETALLRLRLGQTLKEITDRISEEDDSAIIVIAGDFNEDWHDGNTMEQVVGNIDFSQAPLPVSQVNGGASWYCFWLDQTLVLDAEGSYLYHNQWSCFDNILLRGARASEAGVVFEKELKTSDGSTNPWKRNTATGISDHLPVYLVIDI